MSRKDYELIALQVNKQLTYQKSSPAICAGIKILARELGEAFANDNPQFDYDKFIKACGL
jgi:hypothetical protein